MGRKHKYVNKTHYPDGVIERIAHCLYDDMVAFCTSEEGRQEYEAWEAEQQRKASPCGDSCGVAVGRGFTPAANCAILAKESEDVL